MYPGQLTVNPAPLTITANSTSKTYGQTTTFAGTEFTEQGLVNSDTITSVSLTSAGAAATAGVAGSPYTISAANAVGSGLGNYTITYVPGPAHRQPRAADHHGQTAPARPTGRRRPSPGPSSPSKAWSTATRLLPSA